MFAALKNHSGVLLASRRTPRTALWFQKNTVCFKTTEKVCFRTASSFGVLLCFRSEHQNEEATNNKTKKSHIFKAKQRKRCVSKTLVVFCVSRNIGGVLRFKKHWWCSAFQKRSGSETHRLGFVSSWDSRGSWGSSSE